jgi:hypothetical protein
MSYVSLPSHLEQFQNAWTQTSEEIRKHILSILLFVILCMADAVITHYNLSQGAVELNPIISFLIKTTNISSLYILKIVGIIFIIVMLERIRRSGRYHVSRRILRIANYLFFAVCLFALIQIGMLHLYQILA